MITEIDIPDYMIFLSDTDYVLPTGSYFICNPPSLETDYDFLIYTHLTKFSKLESKLLECGYECSYRKPSVEKKIDVSRFEAQQEQEYFTLENDFVSFRKDRFNLIITTSMDFCQKFALATKISKSLNILNKVDRIILFTGIISGVCLDRAKVESKIQNKVIVEQIHTDEDYFNI